MKVHNEVDQVSLNSLMISIRREMFEKHYPREQERLKRLATPRINDWSKIKDVVAYCEANGCPVNATNNSLIIAVIYFLFAEYKLHYNVKLPIGIRDYITEAFCFNNQETVNYYSQTVQVYAKGKNWRDKYEALANGYLEKFGNEGD